MAYFPGGHNQNVVNRAVARFSVGQHMSDHEPRRPPAYEAKETYGTSKISRTWETTSGRRETTSSGATEISRTWETTSGRQNLSNPGNDFRAAQRNLSNPGNDFQRRNRNLPNPGNDFQRRNRNLSNRGNDFWARRTLGKGWPLLAKFGPPFPKDRRTGKKGHAHRPVA